MAYYFDVNTQSHTDYIKRWDSSIVNNVTQELANEAEDDVIDYYTVNKNFKEYIYLEGYHRSNLNDNDDADFLNRFRRAVAHQIWWLYIKQKETTQLYKSRSKGKESVTYDKSVLKRRYPPGFKKHLRKYDRLPVV